MDLTRACDSLNIFALPTSDSQLLSNFFKLDQLDISHHKHGANLKLDLDKDDNGEGSKPASGGEAADGDGGGK